MKTIFTSKFIQIIKTFNSVEMKSFESWLNSPWCNSNKNLIKLFGQIKKYYPDFNNQRLTKEKLFKKILPTGKFSDRRMNNIFSEAYLAAEQFLIFQNLSGNENKQKEILTKELQSRHLEDWFFKDINKAIDRLEAKEIKDWEDHLALLQLHRRIYHHPTARPRMQPGGETIVRMGEELDLVYLLEKAAIINEKIFRKRILKNENHDLALEIQKWRVASEGVEHLAIEFYRKRLEYTEEDMLGQYLVLKDNFAGRFDELNPKEQKIHLMSLLNDTAFLIKAKKLETTECLPLYKLGLQSEILLEQGILINSAYATIVGISNAKHEFSFTREFIKKYTTKLDEKFRVDAINWAEAHTAYYEEKFMDCLNALLNHDFKSPYFQRLSKVLTTQVYFDLYLIDDSYQSYLFNYFDSFEKWIYREKSMSKRNIRSFLAFIQKCRTIAKYYADANFKQERLERLLENETNIQSIFWLDKKINQIILLKKRRPL